MKSESKIIEEQVFNLIDALRSPVLTFSQSWASYLPERLLQVIPIARMGSLIQHEEIASYPEVVAYIMTATLEFPLHGEWVDVYTHVSCKVCQDYWNEDHWDSIQAPRELSGYLVSQYLLPLRRWIYERRRKALKMKMKEEKPIPVDAKEMNKPNIPVVIQEETYQLQLEF